jgi:hypothetical protein
MSTVPRQRDSAFVNAAIAKTRSPARPDDRELEAHRERLKIWNEAETIPGEHPAQSRKCGMGTYRVRWAEFNKMTECGWTIRAGKIVAWIAMDK